MANWGICGVITGWGALPDIPMTETFTGSNIYVTTNLQQDFAGAFKFRGNNSWTLPYNYGGNWDTKTLIYDGPDIFPSSLPIGSYYSSITVNFNTNTFDATTAIQPIPCFNHNTKILCLNKFSKEEYIPIQDLRKGDFVKTYLHGYKRIDMIGMDTMINNPDNWQECMFKMEKTEENGLSEDLIVTGWHSVLVNRLTPEQEDKHNELDFIYHIDNKCLLLASVSEDFQKLENRDEYTYYNLTLESTSENKRYGIYANGILVETPSKKQFLKHVYKELM